MAGIRALQKRAAKLEKAALPPRSPFVITYGSFDAWVEREVLPGIENGRLDKRDMVDVVSALRCWESGTWQRAHGV